RPSDARGRRSFAFALERTRGRLEIDRSHCAEPPCRARAAKETPMRLSRTIGLAVAVSLVAGTVAALARISGAAPADPTVNVVDAAGHLRVPADYRTLYQALGSWAIAADSGQGSKEMHAVYASPGAIDAYRKTGHFPDGAVLVKEVFETSTN